MHIAYIDLPPKLTMDTKIGDTRVLSISNRHSWHANQGEAV
jgi:hypothetical protein